MAMKRVMAKATVVVLEEEGNGEGGKSNGNGVFCFHSRNVDQILCLCLQFLIVPQAMLIKNDPAWKR
jgi:hypothetical protein